MFFQPTIRAAGAMWSSRGFVVARVLRRTDADQGRFQQTHEGGQHLARAQSRLGLKFGDHATDALQGIAERRQVRIFIRITQRRPIVMVAILLAPTGITRGSLNGSHLIGADPHVPIGGRNRQRIDPRHDAGILDAFAAQIEVNELAAQ